MAGADRKDKPGGGGDLRGLGRFQQARIKVGPQENRRVLQPPDKGGKIGPKITEHVVRPGRQDGIEQGSGVPADDIGDQGNAAIFAEIGDGAGRRGKNEGPVEGR